MPTIEWTEIVLRLGLAALLGGLVGLEREMHGRPAGLRTHILVATGAALIVLVSAHGFSASPGNQSVRMDPTRIAAQIVSGIGFIGAGTIVRFGASVKGLTTAASLWVVAGIGIAAGAGFTFGAACATLLVLLTLYGLNLIEHRYLPPRDRRESTLTLSLAHPSGDALQRSAQICQQSGILVRRIEVVPGEKLDWDVRLTVEAHGHEALAVLAQRLAGLDGVRRVVYDR